MTDQEIIDAVRLDLRLARGNVPQAWSSTPTRDAQTVRQHIRNAESKLTQLEARLEAREAAKCQSSASDSV